MIELCSIREVAETAIMQYNQARRWSRAWKRAAKKWFHRGEIAEGQLIIANICIEQLRRWLKKANTENARLRSALEAVEWITRPSGFAVCAWCGHNKKRGHHSECQRQVALGIEVKE